MIYIFGISLIEKAVSGRAETAKADLVGSARFRGGEDAGALVAAVSVPPCAAGGDDLNLTHIALLNKYTLVLGWPFAYDLETMVGNLQRLDE